MNTCKLSYWCKVVSWKCNNTVKNHSNKTQFCVNILTSIRNKYYQEIWNYFHFGSRFNLILLPDAFFLHFFQLFKKKCYTWFINDFRSVPKSILKKFLLINFIPHTLEILFTSYWGNSCIFTTAVKLFVSEIHTKTSKFLFQLCSSSKISLILKNL